MDFLENNSFIPQICRLENYANTLVVGIYLGSHFCQTRKCM